MTLQSRTQPSVRAEDYGRGNAVTFQYAEWTDHERRLNRIREDMMIRAHEKAKLTARPAVERPCTNARKAQGEKTRRAILAAMSHPMTASQIAKHINAKRSNVGEHLRAMASEGIVVVEGGGGSVAQTYRRVKA